MSGPAFFETRMGRTFYETTMPALVREFARLNESLERLIERQASAPHDEQPGAAPEREGDR